MERPWRGGPWLLQEGGEEGLEVGEPRVIGSMLLLDMAGQEVTLELRGLAEKYRF